MVHPQSVIHSMVGFTDGATIAQASPPDMRLPVSLALSWPDRIARPGYGIDWTASHRWELTPLDEDAWSAVALARHVGRRGGTFPAVYNAANEEAVAAFRADRLSFPGIADTIAHVVTGHSDSAGPATVQGVLAADHDARRQARHRIDHLKRRSTPIPSPPNHPIPAGSPL